MSEFQTAPDLAGGNAQAIDPAAAQPNAATTQAQTDGADGGDGSPGTPKTFTQQELDEIVKKRVAKAEDRAERRVLRTLEKLTPQQAVQQQHQPPANEGKPTRAKYASDEAFVDALTDWKLEQREQAKAAEQHQERAKSTSERISGLYAEAEKLHGFDRDDYDALPLTRPIVEALIDSDIPAKLMLHLQQNPAEVDRIAKLSPARQAAEIGKLEDKVAQQKPPARSNAPTALGGAKGSAPGSMPDPGNTKAYIKWANEQERAAR